MYIHVFISYTCKCSKLSSLFSLAYGVNVSAFLNLYAYPIAFMKEHTSKYKN
jgi:hypothetical protein